MSGIVGIWHRDKTPVNRELLEQLASLLDHRGPDGKVISKQGLQGSFGMACQLFNTSPKSFEDHKSIEHPFGTVLLFDGRLDNRDALLGLFEGQVRVAHEPMQPSMDTSDYAFVHKAYIAFHENFVEQLSGDYALSLYDARKETLFLARDGVGMRPLYYAEKGSTFIFSSELKVILAHPDFTPRPNEESLADRVLNEETTPESTLFKGIHSVAPGQRIKVTTDAVEKKQFWEFNRNYKVRIKKREDAADAFEDLLTQSMRRRLRSRYPVAVLLNGDLESAALFCIGLKLRQEGKLPCPGLMGVVPVHPEAPSPASQALLDAIEEKFGVEIHRIPYVPTTSLDQAENTIWQSEDPRYILDEANQRNFYSTIHGTLGARTVLSAEGSREVLFNNGYLVDLFHGLRWIKLSGHLRQLAEQTGDSEGKTVRKEYYATMARFHAPAFLNRMFQLTEKKGYDPLFTMNFKTRARKCDVVRPRDKRRFHTFHARAVHEALRSGRNAVYRESQAKTLAYAGLEISYPYFDRDVLSFWMGIPGLMINHEKTSEGILRLAMREIVPPSVINEEIKEAPKGESLKSMRKEFMMMTDLLAEGKSLKERRYLNQEALAEWVEAVDSGRTKATARVAHRCARLLGFELWLHLFFDEKIPAIREALVKSTQGSAAPHEQISG